jgi:uncharacterized integral membrane protein
MKRSAELALSLVALLLVAGFIAQNPETVTLAFFPGGHGLSLPLGLIVLGGFIGGMAVGALLTWLGLLRRLIAPRRAARRIAALEQELAALRGSGERETGKGKRGAGEGEPLGAALSLPQRG